MTLKELNNDVKTLKDLRLETNYRFSRALGLIISILLFVASLPWASAMRMGFLEMIIILVLAGCLCKVFYECFSMLIDIADASIASLPKDNQNEFPSDPLMLSGVVNELKKISEQNEKQTEALKKSIEELSEKAEKTNTYLYHIYKK